ncbi:hypothetical protein LCGC14_0349660 [marine sediment metagenome]|uniref:Uncharacterized protein n=1 Tax=marine sediment metagenome TaxID=412755 RepID=A0A0F9TGQ3_9ZZZZ
MTTTLLNCEVILSKQIGDYWEGTTTSASGAITIVDTALIRFPDDWITDVSYDMVTSGSRSEEERKISHANSSVSTGTLSVGTHGGSIASGVTYRVHRLFEASEKRRALITAAKNIFPECYDMVWDESLVTGNWLYDGSFEIWDSAGTALSNWVANTVTVTKTTTNGLFKHGLTSAKLSTAAGTLSQGYTENDDLKFLAGKTVRFSVQGHCDTADCLRLVVSDGTTDSFSSYHDGGTAWTENNLPLEVIATIDYNPTEVTFKIVHEVTAATSYVDDARVISDYRGRLYIGHLGIHQNRPYRVEVEPENYSNQEPWIGIHDWEVDEDGYIYFTTQLRSDYRLRIVGPAILDFLSSGTSSESWSATINLNSPQTEILAAEAAVYLYTWMSMPNFESGTREDYQQMLAYWEDKARKKKGKYGMPILPITISWGHE